MNILLINILTISQLIHGAEKVNTTPISTQYMSMGNATTASAYDDMAIFYNPSLLAFMHEGTNTSPHFINLLDIQLITNKSLLLEIPLISNLALSIVDAAKTLSIERIIKDATSIYEIISEKDIIVNLTPLVNIGWAGPIYGDKLFAGIKLITDIKTYIKEYQIGIIPEVYGSIESTSQLILGFAYKFRILTPEWDIPMSIGVNFKALRTINYERNISTASILSIDNDTSSINKIYLNAGYAVDIGSTIQPIEDPFGGRLSVGISINNIGMGNKYIIDAAKIDPIELTKTFLLSTSSSYKSTLHAYMPNVNMGIAYKIPTLWGLISPNWISDFSFAIDFKDLFLSYNDPFPHFLHRIQVGLEIHILSGRLFKRAGRWPISYWFGLPLRLRLGIYDGYPTAGIGMTFLKFLIFDIGVRVQEIGNKLWENPNTQLMMALRAVI